MAATITAGHHAVVYVSGTAATLTNEPTTQTNSHKTYQITAASKRVIDPTYAWTHSTMSGNLTFNRLTGTITSDADNTANEPITFSGKYLPMGQLLYAKDFSLSIKPKITDITPFGQNYQTVTRSLNDVNGTIGTFYDPTEVATLSIAPYWNTEMLADATIAIKFYMSANYSLLAWALMDSEELKDAVDGVLEQTISWSGDSDADGHIVSRL